MEERALELAFEAAAVENVEQRIDIGAGLEFSDARARDRRVRVSDVRLGQQAP